MNNLWKFMSKSPPIHCGMCQIFRLSAGNRGVIARKGLRRSGYFGTRWHWRCEPHPMPKPTRDVWPCEWKFRRQTQTACASFSPHPHRKRNKRLS